jgi:hypothetical protein
MGISLTLKIIIFASITLFIILIVLIHEHERSFNFLVSNFFLQGFILSIVEAFYLLCWVYSQVFNFLRILWMRLISWFLSQSFHYRKTTDFVLLLHPATLPKIFIISNKIFLVESLGSFEYRMLSSIFSVPLLWEMTRETKSPRPVSQEAGSLLH